MKNDINAPIWIVISIGLGLSTLYLSTNLLYGMVKTQPTVILKPNDINLGESQGLKLISIISGRIDTIYYDKLLHKNVDLRYARELSLQELLPNINNRAFLNLNPSVFRWIIFHAVSLSFCLASFIFIFFLVWHLVKLYAPLINTISLLTIIFSTIIVILSLLFISTPHSILLKGDEIMDYFELIFSDPKFAVKMIVIPMFTVSIIPIIGILFINFATYFSLAKNVDNKTPEELKERYLQLKENLNIFSFYLTIFVSCAVIGSGLQREMIITHVNKVLYPVEMVYAYGIAFSMILALFFIPSSVYLRYTGRVYEDSNDAIGKGFWHSGKVTFDNLKLALSIALPVLSSFIQPIISGN